MRTHVYGAALFIVISLTACCPLLVSAAEKWPGVDESVVEKYAREQGREAREPFINTDQGDLLLFVFLVAGAIGGFAAGYYWRMLTAEKSSKTKREEQKVRG
jgi:ABC-type cobalt transport system substrate-binding protein